MNIGRQWEDRLRIWAEQFPKHYYRETETLNLSYFTTMDHLRFDEAVKGQYVPAPPASTPEEPTNPESPTVEESTPEESNPGQGG